MSGNFEISPTFLINVELYLVGIIFRILVLRLLKKEMFLFFQKVDKNHGFNELQISNSYLCNFSLI